MIWRSRIERCPACDEPLAVVDDDTEWCLVCREEWVRLGWVVEQLDKERDRVASLAADKRKKARAGI